MPVVGRFMNTLFENHPLLHQRCLAMDSTPYHDHFDQPLYSRPAHLQLELICLILNIFDGIPEAYKVLHCNSCTTEEELCRFLKRVEKHHDHYLMLDVNKLPFKLQEVSRLTVGVGKEFPFSLVAIQPPQGSANKLWLLCNLLGFGLVMQPPQGLCVFLISVLLEHRHVLYT
jgi:hypothetical protein